MKRITIGDEVYEFMDGVISDNNMAPTVIDVNEIKILSLGTGEMACKLTKDKVEEIRKSGMLALVNKMKIFERFIEGPAKKSTYSAKYRLGDNLMHISFSDAEIADDIDNHESDNIRHMMEAAENAFNTKKDAVLNFILTDLTIESEGDEILDTSSK